MSHEPECAVLRCNGARNLPRAEHPCTCRALRDKKLRAEYQRGREDAAKAVEDDIRANNGCYDLGDTHIADLVAAARGESALDEA